MKNIKMSPFLQRYGSPVLGVLSGVLNGLFGSGGGITVVPMLELLSVPPQKAHATSVAIIFPLSLFTALLYFRQGIPADWNALCYLIPGGLIGALIGTKWLQKLPSHLLRRIFGGIILYAGVRLVFL